MTANRCTRGALHTYQFGSFLFGQDTRGWVRGWDMKTSFEYVGDGFLVPSFYHNTTRQDLATDPLDLDIMLFDGYVRESGDFPVTRPICHVPPQRRFVMQTQTHETTPAAVRPFRINVPEEDLVELRRRVLAARWP